MALEDRQQSIINEFEACQTWEDRYRKIIQIGKQMDALDDSLKSDDLKVKGCQSQVWLKANLSDNHKVEFKADSDAAIVKGLIALLLRLYSDASADEILQTEPTFIGALGLQSHLSPSRANGLVAMVKQIKYYAAAFKALGA